MASPPRRGRTPPVEEPEKAGIATFLAEHRAGFGAVAVVVAAAVVGTLIWPLVSDSTRVQQDAILMPEAVELRGVAPWVHCDLKSEALRNASLDAGLPLDDPELSRRLARAFEMHPWVKLVLQVTPRHPAAAIVEVLCREPVAMVGVEGGLLAVDADGVVLPSADFTAESAALYPRISGVESSPQGPEGSAWGDPVVEEGAALAVAVGPEWKTLQLTECRPLGRPGFRRWELVGPSSRTILFGAAPGREQPGEPLAAAKIARLRAFAADTAGAPATGPLDLTLDPTLEREDAATTPIPSLPSR